MASASDVLSNSQAHMKKAALNLATEFQTIRTGRANPQLLNNIEVEYYGTPVPLKSLANISTPDGKQLLVQPFDKNSLKDIEQAIHKSQLGLTPNNDGSLIRLTVPSPTQERRLELVKLVKKFAEDGRVAIRNIRRHGQEELKKLKELQISEDEIRRQEEALQKITDKHIKEIDQMAQAKESEVMEV